MVSTASLPTHGPTEAQRLSVVCGWVCLALAALLPGAVILFWGTADPVEIAAEIDPSMAGALFPEGLRPWQRALGAGLSLVPAALMSWGLLSARRCLGCFARGACFAPAAIGGLRGFARAVFLAVLASLAMPTLLSLGLTLAHPPGQRLLTIGVSSDQMVGLVVAGLFWAIAGVMARASALAEENAQFV